MGKQKGELQGASSNDDVNMAQSTNDPIRRVAAGVILPPPPDRLARRARLCLQVEAVESATFSRSAGPSFRMRLPDDAGQEFDAYFATIKEDVARLREARALFSPKSSRRNGDRHGINADPRYAH